MRALAADIMAADVSKWTAFTEQSAPSDRCLNNWDDFFDKTAPSVTYDCLLASYKYWEWSTKHVKVGE